MAAEINSLIVKVVSDGIENTTKSLNSLTDASDRAEKSTQKLGNTNRSSSDGAKEAVSAVERLLQKYQTQVDLLGANVQASNAYTAALKGGNSAHVAAAAFLGAEVDAYKALGKAQTEATAYNKALDKSYEQLSKQADAYYASQQRLAASAKAMNEAGYRAQEYKKLADAQAEAIRMNNAFDASLRRQQQIMQARDIEQHNASVRQYSQAHAEAIRMNAAFDVQVRSTTSSIRTNNTAMQEAHALARGLSGSFGALWVTYGNLAGMAVGLAIGQSLKSIVSVGKDVENTLESIRVKGNETTDSVNSLRQAVYDIGKGIYGPQEVAKALETLILAGLNAQQALSAINSTLNLAVAGGTSIEKAASTLVSVGTAIGYVAEGYNRVGDVIAKTAAVSMSSVETLSEAFKSASSVASLYGVTLEDIGTSLGVLSNLGIQGSAAGTALKNMYKELNSEADKVQNTFKQLNISQVSLKNSDGNFKPLLTVVKELDSALSQLSGSEEKVAIARLSNERGLRLITAALDQYRTKTSDTTNALGDMNESVTQSYGFMAKGAVQMSLTAENQLKSIFNSMKVGFAETFKDVEPEIIGVSQKLRQAFQSEEFKDGLRSVATLFANMATTIASNLPIVIALAQAFVALKAAFIVSSVWQAAATGILAVREAMLGLATASAAVNATMGAIGIALGVATLAWLAYKAAQEDSMKAQKAAVDYSEGYIDGLRKEADNLEKVNEKLREGIALKDVQKKVESDNSRLLQVQKEADAVEEARKNLDKAQKAIENSTFFKNSLSKTSDLVLAKKALADAEEHQRQSAIAAYDEEFRLNLLAKENADLVTQAQKNSKAGREEAALTLATKEKEKAIGLTAITAELKAIDELKQKQLNADSERLVSTRELYKLEKINVVDAQNTIEQVLKDKIKIQNSAYLFEQDAILKSMSLEGRSAEEKNTLQGKLSDSTKRHSNAVSELNQEITKNSSLIETVFKKAYDAEDAAIQKSIESTKAKTKSIQNEVDAYNRLPEAVRSAGVTDKQMRDQVTQSAIDDKQKEIDLAIDQNVLGQDRINLLIKERDELINLRDVQSTREAQQATNKAAQEYTTAWKQANKQIGDGLASAIIDGGGKGWKKLIRDMEMGFAKTVLQPILAPISAGIASLTTTVGASSPGAVAGTASGAVGLAQSAMNAYSLISKGFQGIETSVTSMAQGVLNHFGVTTQYAGSGLPSTTALGAGSIASTAAGIGGGLLLGNSISGQYGSSGTVAAGTAVGAIVGSIVPVLGTALGSFLGGTVGGILNRAFGMGNKNVTSQGISGTIAESGVTGQSYQNWRQSGGWFRSDKSGTEKQDLATDVINTFASGLTSLKATSTDFAKNLNVSADALTNYSKTFDIALTSDTAANQKAITDFFTTMGDDMATKLVPNIAEFSKSGETASGTLQRLSETFAATNQIAQILGNDMSKVFGGLGLESAKARQYLVDLAGGISALNTQVTFYATNFLTDAEKIAPVQKAVVTALAEMGLSGVTTVEQFKAIVNSLDLSTQAGAQTFESLMQLAPAFKQVADASDAAAQAAKDQAAADLASAEAAKKAKLDSFQTMKDVATSDFNVLSKSISQAKTDAQSAYDAQAAILNAQISSLQASSTAIGQLTSSLESALNSVVSNTVLGMTRATAQATLDDVLNTARTTGVLPTAEGMKDTLSMLTKDSSSSFSSYTEYMKDQGITAGKIADLRDISKDQGNTVEKQLQVAKDQLDQAKKSLDAQLAKYDAILGYAQEQLDAMNGTTVAIKELTSALSSFNASSRTAISNGVSIGAINQPANASSQDIVSLYSKLLNRTPDAAGLDYWNTMANTSNLSTSQIAQFMMQSSEYINGSHANGLDSVPFDGYTAKLHKGEMVLPAKQASGVAQGDNIKEVVEKLQQLCEANGIENRAMNSELVKIRKILVNVTPTNDRIQVHEVGAA